jgi:hypothetical protein
MCVGLAHPVSRINFMKKARAERPGLEVVNLEVRKFTNFQDLI